MKVSLLLIVIALITLSLLSLSFTPTDAATNAGSVRDEVIEETSTVTTSTPSSTSSTPSPSSSPSSSSSPFPSKRQPAYGGHAFFVAIPLPGHLNPLIAQANELASRPGWTCTIASAAPIESHVMRTKAANVNWINFGTHPTIEQRNQKFAEAANMTSFMENMSLLGEWALSTYEFMYPAMISAITELEKTNKVTIVIADAGSMATMDAATTLGLPVIINNADLLFIVSTDLIPDVNYLPFALQPLSNAHMISPDTYYGLLARTAYPALKLFARVFIEMTHTRTLNVYRELTGNPDRSSIHGVWRHRLVLQNSAFGFEFNRPLPPNVHMVGPQIDLKIQRTADDDARVLAHLDATERAWLENPADSRPVVYVSMGTLAPSNPSIMRRMFAGLQSSSSFRALVKLSRHDQDIIRDNAIVVPDNVKIVTWVSSQHAIFAHPAVRVFISHCGVNSAHESLYYGTPMLCIPMFADQGDMAQRVVDYGVGLRVDKESFTAEQLHDAVNQLLHDPSYVDAVQRVSASIALSGGVKRAVDIIEHAQQFGVRHFLTNDQLSPWYVQWSFDLYAVWFVLIALCWFTYRSTRKSSNECIDARKKNAKKNN